MLSYCSLIGLLNPWLMSALLSDIERWRLAALDKLEPNEHTNIRRSAFLELLSEPKKTGELQYHDYFPTPLSPGRFWIVSPLHRTAHTLILHRYCSLNCCLSVVSLLVYQRMNKRPSSSQTKPRRDVDITGSKTVTDFQSLGLKIRFISLTNKATNYKIPSQVSIVE